MSAARIAPRDALIGGVALLLTVYMIYATVFGPYHTTLAHLSIFSAVTLFIYFIGVPASPDGGPAWLENGLAVAAAIAAAASFGYIVVNVEHIISVWGASYLTLTDLVMGGMVIAVSLEAARRQSSGLFWLGVVSIAYMLFGNYIPGIFSHTGIDLDRIIYLVAYTNEGIFGSGIEIAASYLFMLLLLSAAFNATRTGEVITKLATGMVGRQTGGSAKAAMLASAGLGTVVGSSIGNVVSTGMFTIPLMIRTGYRRHVAAAIETNASEGAQLMPPVLGASAFIMVQLTGIPYATIVIASIAPAILYYLSLWWVAHIEALKDGVGNLSESEIPSIWQALKDGGHLLLAPALLFYLIAAEDLTPAYASLYCLVFGLVVGLLRRMSRYNWRQLVHEIIEAVKQAADMTALVASIGLLQAALMTTGLGPRLTEIILSFSDGSLLVTSLLALVASIFLGLGMPTPIAYLLTAIVAAPALEAAGASKLAAHMFLFYFAIKSGSTPPIAIVATVSATIAKADWLKTANTAFIQSLPGFIVAFNFLFAPDLLGVNGLWPALVASFFACFGVFAIAAAVQGWCVGWLSGFERALVFAAGLALVLPDYWASAGGLALLGAVALRHKLKSTTLMPPLGRKAAK